MGDSVELEIRITGQGGRQYRASVVKGPSQVGSSRTFELPALAPAVGDGDWRDVRREAASSDRSVFSILNEQGRFLFDLVFIGELYAAFFHSYQRARDRGIWFRLQLSFDNAPAAIDLPWEALVNVREGYALALLERVSIERRLIKPLSIEVPRPAADGKIRALIAGACPRGMAPISVEAERKWIKAALGKGVETRLLEHTNLAGLGKELADSAGFDLVHFLGHGDFEGEEGGLWLEDERGEGLRLSSREIPATLRRPVSFVFLNVCHGGRSSANPFAGLAETLLGSGVRAVVAMRREISDKGAVALAKKFYQSLGEGETLTHALAKARQSVVDAHSGDWAVPMLFLAGEDFALLPRPIPIGELLGPKRGPTSAESPEGEFPVSPARPLFAAAATKTPWTLKRTVALVLAVLVSAFGMWFVWPTVDDPAPAAIEPQLLVGPAGSADGKNASEPEVPRPAGAAPAAVEKKPAAEPGPKPREATVPPSPPPSDENARRCPGPADPRIEFVFIRAGSFLQGNDKGKDEEKPAHPVELTADYCLGKYEITWGQYAAVMKRQVPSPSEAKLPMASVRESEIQEFLKLLNSGDPKAKYQLPTDSQWEFAARAGSSSRYSFGEDEMQLFRYGNCLARNGASDGYDSAAPVGTFKPNAWGLYDMHGNVWELVQDYWSYYAPDRAVDPRGPGRGASRVRRGGAYDSAVENCRSSSRQDADPNRRQKTIGFRIARSPVR